jgi:acyl-CoA synthetase (AMP-forming)/AMP-acid ligase II
MNGSGVSPGPPALAWRTLVDVLEHRGRTQPTGRAFVFLENGQREGGTLTFGELAARARRVGAALQARRAAGERVLLLYPTGLDFVAAFFGCLYAGATPVPVPAGVGRSRTRLLSIAADCHPRLALTTGTLAGAVGRRLPAGDVTVLGHEELLAEDEDWAPPTVDGDTLALLQYTSGSTDAAKGVMVTHANILHNQTLIRDKFEHTTDSVMLSWLPVFHDMGLIGKIVQPLYVGCPCVLMAPEAFLQEPARWLRAITRYRATTSGAPNFAYDLCVDRVPAADRAPLDLGSWRVAFNGSEPIRPSTLERFVSAFAPHGFRREAFYPCYGLAEATLLATGGRRADPPVVITRADPSAEPDGRAGTAGVRALVGCGDTGPSQDLRIVDPSTAREVPDGAVGEIWLSGPSVGRGYWARAEETRATFGACTADTGQGPFLRTGDLGFLAAGELFVTGRLKELLIVRGRNHYPQDVERTAEESHPALLTRAGAAFVLEEEERARLVLAHEVRPEFVGAPPTREIARRIREAVSREHGLHVAVLALLPAGAIPRTSSGKIQRRLCQARYVGGTLGVIDEDRHGASAVPAPMARPDPVPGRQEEAT